MAFNNGIVRINADGVVEPKRLNTGSDLINLLRWM
jgi:hypothetical protein